ncbi:hypothetical protein Ppro_2379 [Pelobacter propionicus DSM 2379]|uniref:Uncharacterized protein n=1 Tax=Pelobacter propionicus (strain DSM 2379 / NBRC 103807 / OttBd1) TaxID=338966 RepID=A1ARL5_PELPD|nr:hypothetical protein Ppro_2379 [Pelobacter propionicus DSM 2379]
MCGFNMALLRFDEFFDVAHDTATFFSAIDHIADSPRCHIQFSGNIRLLFAHLQERNLDFDCPGRCHLLISFRAQSYKYAFSTRVRSSQ